MNASEKKYLGIDIAKESIYAFLYPTNEVWNVKNEPNEIVEWIKKLPGDIELAVMEATGRLEELVAAQLNNAGIPICIVNPRQIKDYAKCTGRLAKTDKIDAETIAMFANTIKPQPQELPDEMESALKDLVIRRLQIVDLITEEKNHLSSARSKLIKKDVEETIKLLQKRLAEIESKIKDMIRQSPIWRKKVKILTSVTGVGPVTAIMMIAKFPELGSITGREAASLAGLAPMARQSGKWKGKSYTQGGRKHVRTSLFMACLSAIRYNPVIKTFYERLIAIGKPTMIAITACMRKLLTILNALLRDNSMWRLAYI
jgi:transposase